MVFMTQSLSVRPKRIILPKIFHQIVFIMKVMQIILFLCYRK